MEALIPYLIPGFLVAMVLGLMLGSLMYFRLRIRWHKKGILDYNYDGLDHRNDPNAKSVFDCWQEEKEYDRKMKEFKNALDATDRRVAVAAAKVLRDPKSSKSAKTVARSALTQRSGRSTPKKNTTAR